MAANEISETRVRLGQRVLDALDRAGLLPESAFWVHNPRQDRWTLLAVSKVAEDHGRWPVYQALLGLYPQLDWPRSFSIFSLEIEPARGSTTAAPILAQVRTASRRKIAVRTGYGDELGVVALRVNEAPRSTAAERARREFRRAVLKVGGRRRLLRAA
jgi:hypothetical protein